MKNFSNQKIIKEIKDKGLPIIIFGAGIVGEVILKACCDAGIKVECFCDNNINKKADIEVIPVSDLKKKYQDAIFLISAADIKDVVEQLSSLGFSKWYPSNLLLKDFDIFKYQFSAPSDFVQYAVDTCLFCHDSYLTPDKLFLRSVDIIITERCSLKCRDCSNLTQYYKNPKDCDAEELMKSIDTFCSIMDEVNEFRVIGGDPFMNRDFDLVIKRLIDEPKVKKIIVYVNGTIVPPDEKIECLKNNKVLLMITDYGLLSRNLDALIQKLSSKNIAFYSRKAQGWTDCSKIKRHNRNPKQQKEIFGKCCAKNTVNISDGKLYRCPFIANAARLRAVPDCKNDYIDLFQEPLDEKGILATKNKVRDYLLNKDYLEACDFCNGRSFGDSEITPSIQTSKPLEYEQYQKLSNK
ncbi:radical SAM protein [Patescibacteria group bacterium]|nr:radical SAM protein [Patescibacteria group bacterium]